MSNKKKTPENTGRKQDGQFLQGVSGNPAGKPKGARHKVTQAAMTLLEGEAETLIRKAIELALNGDITALKLCLDRLVPALKSISPPIRLEEGVPDTLTDTAKIFVKEAAEGNIPPDIAAQLVSAVASVARVEEIEQVKQRLEALELAIKEQSK